MSRIIDADSHFMEPLDLWERYIEPEFRTRCLRFTQDPDERLLPYMVELLGDHKFFIGSDYPHAEGFTNPMAKAQNARHTLPEVSVNKILGENAVQFFGHSTK